MTRVKKVQKQQHVLPEKEVPVHPLGTVQVVHTRKYLKRYAYFYLRLVEYASTM